MGYQKDDSFFAGRFKSIGFAFRGAFKLITTEHSIMVQSLAAVILIIAGFYFKLTATEWMFQILAMGLVLGIEGMNTAIEKICDFVHPDYHEKIGFIKDISAGAVLLAVTAAVAIGCIIYVPKFIDCTALNF